MSRLLAGQYSKHYGELAYCCFCCHGFEGTYNQAQGTWLEDAKRRRDEHEKECFVHCGQLLTFPQEDYVEFESIHKQVEHPFVVYADFESILRPIDEEKPKTKRYQEHDACSFSYYIVSRVPGVSFQPKTYIGKMLLKLS